MRLPARSRAVRRAAPLVILSLLWGCATNPATGQRQLMLVTEGQEIEMGRQADKEVEASFGLYADAKIQAYVARLGASLVAGSERPNLPWTFRVVDDPTVNAFALPGGFIYVTRGLMTHLNSEAELVSVLGHEIGHVTARHSAAMISKQQFAMLGLGVGMIVRPELQQFGDLAQAGVGLMFLKFGRDAERQADDLGLRYIGRQGYDPREAVEVFSVLDRASQKSGEGRLPSWLSTHPAPEDRAQRLQAAITAGNLSGSKVERRAYLDQLDGMIFGENPREGFFVQNDLLPSRDAVLARLSPRLEGREPAAGGGRGEPEPGCDRRALAGPRHERGPGRAGVLPPAGRAPGRNAARDHQRDARDHRDLRGRVRPDADRGPGGLHRARRQGVPGARLHAAGEVPRVRRRLPAGDPELRQPDRPPIPRRAAAAHRDRALARGDDGRGLQVPPPHAGERGRAGADQRRAGGRARCPRASRSRRWWAAGCPGRRTRRARRRLPGGGAGPRPSRARSRPPCAGPSSGSPRRSR